MKHLYIFSLFMLSLVPALADDNYTNNLYTSATLSYWCKYKELPASKGEIAKVTEINYHDPNITMDLDEWLQSVSYEINGEILSVIKESKTIAKRNTQITVTSKSSSNCGLYELIKKKEDEFDF